MRPGPRKGKEAQPSKRERETEGEKERERMIRSGLVLAWDEPWEPREAFWSTFSRREGGGEKVRAHTHTAGVYIHGTRRWNLGVGVSRGYTSSEISPNC